MTYDEIEDLYKSLRAEKWPVEWEFIVRDSPFGLTGKEIAIQYLDEKQDVFFVFEFYPTDHYNHKPYWKYIETEYIPTLIKNYAQNGQIYTYVYGHGWMHAILLEACGYDPDDYNPAYFEGLL